MEEEMLNDAPCMVDGDIPEIVINKAAAIISNFTGVDSSKLANLIWSYGIDAVFNNSTLSWINEEQREKLKELKELLDLMEGWR